jgi:arsenate reductase
MGQRLRWQFEDPVKYVGTEEEKLKKFREIRDQIKWKVKEWVDNQK